MPELFQTFRVIKVLNFKTIKIKYKDLKTNINFKPF